MPMGDPGGHFADTGGYGGNYGGAGGASRNAGQGEHGGLGWGGMSPGGFNSSTYARNAAGYGGPGSGNPGFGARVAAFAAQRRAQQAYNKVNGTKGRGGTVGIPSAITQVAPGIPEMPPDAPPPVNPATGLPYPGMGWGNYQYDNKYSTGYVNDPNFPGWGSVHGPGQIGAGEYGYGGLSNQIGAMPTGQNSSNMNQNNMGGGAISQGGLGTMGGATSGNYGGPREHGGPVKQGKTYTVGESGPEILKMGAKKGGEVVPLKIGAPLMRITEQRMAERAARKRALTRLKGMAA